MAKTLQYRGVSCGKPDFVLVTPANSMLLKAARLAALEDSPGAFGSTFAEESRWPDSQWQQRAFALSQPGAIAYLALDGSQPCGIARASVSPGDETASIASVWVALLCRRSGIAAHMLGLLTAWAAASGAKALVLVVTSNNEPAIRFYRHLGFTMTGRSNAYPNDSTLSELEMMHRL